MEKDKDGKVIEKNPDKSGVDLLDRPEQKIKTDKPSMWNVIIKNDDWTPMDFVVFILQKVFHKSEQEAIALMMDVHLKGKGIAGTYTFEVAESKQMLTMEMAKLEQHPLMVVLEKA